MSTLTPILTDPNSHFGRGGLFAPGATLGACRCGRDESDCGGTIKSKHEEHQDARMFLRRERRFQVGLALRTPFSGAKRHSGRAIALGARAMCASVLVFFVFQFLFMSV